MPSKKRYYVKFSYDGSKFYGFQKQPNVRTIQQDMEEEFQKLAQGRTVKLIASGRTDRYVHAKNQVGMIETKGDLNRNWKGFNVEGVKIKEFFELKNKEWHPRYSSKQKVYTYKIKLKKKNGKKLPKDHDYRWNYNYNFDYKKLKSIIKNFEGEHDFGSFTAKESYDSTVRTIDYVKVRKRGRNLRITVSSKGFMRFQVRMMVGTMMAHNRGKISDEKLQELFDNPERGAAHYKAPGSGLYLVYVGYNNEKVE